MTGLRHFSIVIAIRIILIIASILVVQWLASLQTNVNLIYVLGGIFVIVQGTLLFQYVTNVNRKLTYFLESVRYSDFTINFRHDNKMGKTFQELNQQFNEVLHAFRQARAEKEANLQYLNTIVQHIGTGLITFDSTGQVNLINNAALRMLGIYRLHQLIELKDKHPRLYELLSNLDSGVRELYRTPSDRFRAAAPSSW